MKIESRLASEWITPNGASVCFQRLIRTWVLLQGKISSPSSTCILIVLPFRWQQFLPWHKTSRFCSQQCLPRVRSKVNFLIMGVFLKQLTSFSKISKFIHLFIYAYDLSAFSLSFLN